MSSPPLSATPIDDRMSHLQDVFVSCVELGHELAQLAIAPAKETTLPVDNASIAYHRTTRSMRLSAWLIRKLGESGKIVDRVAARKRIFRTVEDVIQRHEDDVDTESLQEELMDRMDSPDLEDEIRARPIEDIITDIVRDLGLAQVPGNHPWKRRTPEDLARLCALAAQAPGVEGTTVLSRAEGRALACPQTADSSAASSNSSPHIFSSA